MSNRTENAHAVHANLLRRLARWFDLEVPDAEQAASRRHRTDLVHTWIPLAIATVSIAGALLAWRASSLSSDGSDLGQVATQQLLQQRQVFTEFQALITHDQRLTAQGEELYKRFLLLRDQGRAIESDREWSLYVNLLKFYWVGDAVGDPDSAGNITYDPKLALRLLKSRDESWAEVQPGETMELARTAQNRAHRLIGIEAILVVSLFFLTVAQLVQPSRRRLSASIGGAMALASLVLYLIVGP